MPASSWIAHVKSVYSKGSMAYKDALKAAAKTWKKNKGAAAAPAKLSKRKSKDEQKDNEEDALLVKPKRRRKRARPT